MPDLGYGIFDCDTHCYETRDAFTRYLPKAYQAHAIAPIQNAAGEEILLAGYRIATFNSEQGLGYDLAYRPGTLKEMLKQMGSGNPEETLPASADAAGVHRAGAAAQDARDPGRRAMRPFPGRWRTGRRALRRRHRRPLRQPGVVQPSGTTRRGASTTKTRSTPPP